ncbi:hypothetical protein EV121DRAFT_297458 [Schizophyllum commune]
MTGSPRKRLVSNRKARADFDNACVEASTGKKRKAPSGAAPRAQKSASNKPKAKKDSPAVDINTLTVAELQELLTNAKAQEKGKKVSKAATQVTKNKHSAGSKEAVAGPVQLSAAELAQDDTHTMLSDEEGQDDDDGLLAEQPARKRRHVNRVVSDDEEGEAPPPDDGLDDEERRLAREIAASRGTQAGTSESTGLQLEHDSSDDGGCDTGRADIDSDAMDVDEDEVEVVEVDDLSPNGIEVTPKQPVQKALKRTSNRKSHNGDKLPEGLSEGVGLLATAAAQLARQEALLVDAYPADVQAVAWKSLRDAAAKVDDPSHDIFVSALATIAADPIVHTKVVNYVTRAHGNAKSEMRTAITNEIDGGLYHFRTRAKDDIIGIVAWQLDKFHHTYGGLHLKKHEIDFNKPFGSLIFTTAIGSLLFGQGKANSLAGEAIVRDGEIPKNLIVLISAISDHAIGEWSSGKPKTVTYNNKLARETFVRHAKFYDKTARKAGPQVMQRMQHEMLVRALDGVGKSYLLDLQDEADDELDKTDWSKLQQDFGGMVGQSAASNEA